MSDYGQRIPVIIVTGFLGSGKTTLLNHVLKDAALADCAVLVNEFGAIGLDHHLLEHIDGNTVLLANGCVCCTIRDDLKNAVLELHDRRARSDIPAYARLIIETTGLADPTPVVATFLSDVTLRYHYRPALVITTVDAVHGLATLAAHAQSRKQAALADRLVLTKIDLGEPTTITALRAQLIQINSSAQVLQAVAGALDVHTLLRGDVYAHAHRDGEVSRWFKSDDDHAHHRTRHHDDIHSFCVTTEVALDWTAFGVWLTLLLHRHGDKVLRVKGLLNIVGVAAPVVINGVQHMMHPPVHLSRWPDDDRRSRIVFIVQGLAQAVIEESLAVFNQLAPTAA
jgi:G3E family GTPase